MLFNSARCRTLRPERVNWTSGWRLHQFGWLDDGEIGSLPPEWNVLVGVQPDPEDAKLLPSIPGDPWFEEGQDRRVSVRAGR